MAAAVGFGKVRASAAHVRVFAIQAHAHTLVHACLKCQSLIKVSTNKKVRQNACPDKARDFSKPLRKKAEWWFGLR